jgi:hypothetical protein
MPTQPAQTAAALPAGTPRADAARILGVAPARVGRLIEKKDLAGFRLGGRWYVTTASLTAYIAALDDAGVPRAGRGGLTLSTGARLFRFCVTTGRSGAVRVSTETGRYLFRADAIDAWLRNEGRKLIAEHRTARA